MWFRNKRTGVPWDVSAPDLIKRLTLDPGYEECEPPAVEAAPAQAPGGSVLHSEAGETDMLASPPGGTSLEPSPQEDVSQQQSNTDDHASDNTITTGQPRLSTGSPPKRARKSSRRNGV